MNGDGLVCFKGDFFKVLCFFVIFLDVLWALKLNGVCAGDKERLHVLGSGDSEIGDVNGILDIEGENNEGEEHNLYTPDIDEEDDDDDDGDDEKKNSSCKNVESIDSNSLFWKISANVSLYKSDGGTAQSGRPAVNEYSPESSVCLRFFPMVVSSVSSILSSVIFSKKIMR